MSIRASPSQIYCTSKVSLNDCHAHIPSMCLHAAAMGSPGLVSPQVIMHELHTPAMALFLQHGHGAVNG